MAYNSCVFNDIPEYSKDSQCQQFSSYMSARFHHKYTSSYRKMQQVQMFIFVLQEKVIFHSFPVLFVFFWGEEREIIDNDILYHLVIC